MTYAKENKSIVTNEANLDLQVKKKEHNHFDDCLVTYNDKDLLIELSNENQKITMPFKVDKLKINYGGREL